MMSRIQSIVMKESADIGTSWKDRDYTVQPQIMCQATTALVLAWDDEDEQSQPPGDQQPWDFGDIVIVSGDKEVRRAPAALVHYDCWFVITTLEVESAIQHTQSIKWQPKPNILNYQRRFTMIDMAYDIPMLKMMAGRSTFMEERLNDDMKRIEECKCVVGHSAGCSR
ncbi:hypothetical protein PINS_up016016 [Pythium insidiosum]|nr:hypothetical protein PINS_up016016 [Pythium insidiosum]